MAPTTSTFAPSPGATASTALIAVVPATPSDPASWSDSPSGAIATAAAWGFASSANAPSWIAGFEPIVPNTRSPTENPSTPSPSASIVPATSFPITAGNSYGR